MSNNSKNKAALQEQIQDLKDLLEEQISSNDAAAVAESKKMLEDLEAQLKAIDATPTIEPGTENLVQLKVQFGNRFSARTGKEVNPPKPMYLTFGEWQLFKESHQRLGYRIIEVLNDPFGDASQFVTED